MPEAAPGWALDTAGTLGMTAGASSAGQPTDEIADRTNVITARLKAIYRKNVLPVEQRYKYDYFYESPLLSDVEFDGASDEPDSGSDECL